MCHTCRIELVPNLYRTMKVLNRAVFFLIAGSNTPATGAIQIPESSASAIRQSSVPTSLGPHVDYRDSELEDNDAINSAPHVSVFHYIIKCG